MSFVLGSSVALAWVLPDEGNPYANELLERLIAEGAVVPPIWPLEIGNVLLVALRRRCALGQALVLRAAALCRFLDCG